MAKRVRLTDHHGYDWVDYTERSPKVVVVEVFKARAGKQAACRIARSVMSRDLANTHFHMMQNSLDYRVSSRA